VEVYPQERHGRQDLDRECVAFVLCGFASSMVADVVTNFIHYAVLVYAGSAGPLYAFALFLPSIINQVSINVPLRPPIFFCLAHATRHTICSSASRRRRRTCSPCPSTSSPAS
jgi:hypothetical protein